jgi:hypothetical protein
MVELSFVFDEVFVSCPVPVADCTRVNMGGLLMILQRDRIRKLGIAVNTTEVVDCLLMRCKTQVVIKAHEAGWTLVETRLSRRRGWCWYGGWWSEVADSGGLE